MAENEDKRILCEECGQREAMCTVAVMMGAKAMHRRLCHECMAKASMSIASGNLSGVLEALLAAARNAAQPEKTPQPQSKKVNTTLPELPGEAENCPQCGMTYQVFRKEGRLGCAQCATAFRQTLLEALRRSDAGESHTGRKQLFSSEAIAHRARQMTLQRQLDEAIACEDYDAAAHLRDALRMLDAKEGQTDA